MEREGKSEWGRKGIWENNQQAWGQAAAFPGRHHTFWIRIKADNLRHDWAAVASITKRKHQKASGYYTLKIPAWAYKCVPVWRARHSFQPLKSSRGISEPSESQLPGDHQSCSEGQTPSCMFYVPPLCLIWLQIYVSLDQWRDEDASRLTSK